MLQTDLADLVRDAARRVRRTVWPSSSRGGRGAHLAPSSRARSRRFATGLGALGILAGAARDDRDRQPARVRHELPRRPARAGRRRTVNPRSTADELARMIADSGTRARRRRRRPRSTPSAPPARRWSPPSTATQTDLEADLVGRAHRPRIVAVDARPPRARCRTPTCVATGPAPCRPCPTRRSSPPCSTRAGPPADRAPRCSPTARCWPTSTQVGEVEPPMIHGDDVVLGVLPLFHVYGLNAVLGGVLRHRAKLLLVEHWRPARRARPDRGRGGQRAADRAAGLRPLARRSRTSPSGSARCGWCSPARRRCAAR